MIRRHLPCVVIAAFLAACAAKPPDTRVDADRRQPASAQTIYVVRRGWHIDVGVAAADLGPALAPLRTQLPATGYVLFGFGDRHYLLARGRHFGSLLEALRRGPGLVLATGLQATPQAAFGPGQVVEIEVLPAQARNLQAFIRQTLPARPATVVPLADGPYAGSRFYAAIPSYSALHTCNTWAAEALRAAGLPVRSQGIEFSGQLWRQLRRLCGRQLTCTAG